MKKFFSIIIYRTTLSFSKHTRPYGGCKNAVYWKFLVVASIYFAWLILCAGCGFLPVEEETLAPPVIKSYESARYSTFKVTRGNIAQWKTVRFTYVPTYTETLSFRESDVYFDETFAEEGDFVKTGDIIATLDCAELNESITDIENQLENIAITRTNDAAMRVIDEKVARLNNTLKEVNQNYNAKEENLQYTESILRFRLEELNRKRGNRTLIAGMDGIITYIYNAKDGERSENGAKFAVITDKNNSVFSYTGDDAALFTPGDNLDISIGSDVFLATVVTAGELGIIDPKPNTVYAALEQVNVTIKENATGLTEVLITEAKNVLFVPSGAVRKVRDRFFVYMIVDGARITNDVEIGLDNGLFTEIKDGLSEGDEVVSGGIS